MSHTGFNFTDERTPAYCQAEAAREEPPAENPNWTAQIERWVLDRERDFQEVIGELSYLARVRGSIRFHGAAGCVYDALELWLDGELQDYDERMAWFETRAADALTGGDDDR